MEIDAPAPAPAPAHAYRIKLDATDPPGQQPPRITKPLKPHQLAAIAKATIMEREGRIRYNVPDPHPHLPHSTYYYRNHLRGNVQIRANIGILGDVVGTGKTLTALSIIAATPTRALYEEQERIVSFAVRNYSHFTAVCSRAEEIPPPATLLETTLVVVPRGPVFGQWEKEIAESTGLRLLALESVYDVRRMLPPSDAPWAVVKAFFEAFDIVMIKNTNLHQLINHFTGDNAIQGFARIMVDEAHELIARVPLLRYRFIWLISATYWELPSRMYGSRGFMSYSVREVISDERMLYMLVCGEEEWARASFRIPDMEEHIYVCQAPRQLSAVQDLLRPSVLERINANDIAGAIREMGGNNETEEDLVALVSRDLERSIRSREERIALLATFDMSEETRATRLQALEEELAALRGKLEGLRERVTDLANKTCPICYDNYTNPIVLSCSHVFCGACLINWMRAESGPRSCPACRAPIVSTALTAVVAQKAPGAASATREEGPRTKVDTAIQILRGKPTGRFVIFTRVDAGFVQLQKAMGEAGIRFEELKGTTGAMTNILKRFREGVAQVLLLSTHHAGSGIDISFATDMILLHELAQDSQQAIGRCQRMGRTSPLHLHRLCYPNELVQAPVVGRVARALAAAERTASGAAASTSDAVQI